MKTITFNQIKLTCSNGTLLLFLLLTCTTFAQLQNNGTLFVSDNGILCLRTGNYGFGTGTASTATTRTTGTFGKLVFGSTTTASGASNDHFINGYARTLSDNPYTLFLGQTSVLAPIRIDAATIAGVDAAFYKATPPGNSTIDPDLSEIAADEYWDIQGVNARIALSWRPATIANFSTSDLSIVAFNTFTNVWDIIPSTVDVTSFLGGPSTSAGGSVTSDALVDLTIYRFFTVGAKGDPCAPLVVSSGILKRWTGSAWVLNSDGTTLTSPTIADPVIIDGDYGNGSFSCNSIVFHPPLTLDPPAYTITLANDEFIDCVNAVTGPGTVILASEANFVQRNNASQAPSIVLNKRTREDMRRFDYIYWGSPISGTDVINQIYNSQAGENALIGPNTLVGALDNFLKYTSGLAVGTSGWQVLDQIVTGRGFIARVKQQAPFTNAIDTDFINLSFTGEANNGTVNVGITNNILSPFGGSSHNLLANPYPSAIDADKFLTANDDVDGVIYIWTASTPPNLATGSYSQADYISFTRLGSTAVDGISDTFTGRIASGQGFKVRSLVPGGTATFNNCMRLTTGNNQFFKSLSIPVVARDSYKITMTGANGVYSQVLVGYTPETTIGYDRMYDATRNSVSTAQVYTLLDNTTRRLAINARPSFVNTDKVALGISKNNTNAETFVFAISGKEGLFNTDAVTVYLHDKVLDTYHNFNNGSFAHTSSVTNLATRFDLVYLTDSQLTNPVFNASNTLVSLNKNIFIVNSTGIMSSIVIYDIAGRLINTYSNIDNTIFTSSFTNVQGVYVAKIKMTDGTIVTEKVINQ